jgi:hypothetical protein
MGWWHGHLLKDKIRALHEVWQRQAFAEGGDLASPAAQERRTAALALVEPVLERHLPEDARREYDGLAAGCGLPVRTLLLTEMLTDILRFTDKEPRLLSGNFERKKHEMRLARTGPWEPLLAPQWLWITRRSAATSRGITVLTWPGSLGCVLGARGDGLAALAYEVPLESERQGLRGVPFRVSLRRALERALDPRSLLAALSNTTAHNAVAVDFARGIGLGRLVELTGEDWGVELSAPEAGDPAREDETWRRQNPTDFRVTWRDGAVWMSLTSGGVPKGREIRVP